jgi:serine/threonine protein kinase
MSKILFLPSRRIYHGRAGSEEICGLATDDWEISPDDFKLQGNLGKGQFGDVKIALIENMSCTSKLRNYMDRRVAAGESLSTSSAVAVKYLRDTTTNEKRILFLEEIALMKKVSEIGNNHVVQLLGCITLKTPMAMVMEFCPFGDLRSNLIQWREEASEYGACCY